MLQYKLMKGAAATLIALLASLVQGEAQQEMPEHTSALHDDLRTMNTQVFTQAEHAQKRLDRLLETLPSSGGNTEQWIHMRRAQAQALLLLFNEMAESLAQASTLQTRDADEETQTLLLILQGTYAHNVDEYTRAKQQLNRARLKAQAADLLHLELAAAAELAYVHTLLDDHENALHINNDAHLKALNANDVFMIGYTHYVYGASFLQLKQYEQSIEHNKKALEIFTRLGFPHHEAMAIFGVAAGYRYWGKFDDALENYQLYRKTIAFTESDTSKYYADHGMATTLAEKGDCDQALNIIARARKIEGTAGWDAELYKKEVLCYTQKGDFDKAATALKEVKDIFLQLSDLHNTVWEIEVLKLESELERAKGNSDLALDLLIQYYDKQQNLENRNHSTRLLKARAALENQRKDLEIRLLKEKTQVQRLVVDAQERKNKQQTLITAIALTVIVLSILFFILQYRNTKRVFELSIRDDLSGLYNRRYIFGALKSQIPNKSSSPCEFSVLLIDVDDFKQINDLHGHAAGDTVIHSLADLSLEVLRMSDILGRIGGEEFFYILPRTTPEQAEQIASRLLEAIESKVFILKSGKTLNVTVSMGVCHYDLKTRDAETLYAEADKALYEAKHLGKNQLVVAK
jgi:diguanylate cyclase (GGDEF)-like protein